MSSSIARQKLDRRLADARAEVERIPGLTVRDPRGGLAPVATLTDDLGHARHAVLDEQGAGSQLHRRISRAQRRQLQILPVLDGLVLAWFLTGVLNVDLRHPDVTLLVALALAALCTVAVAAWVSAVGRHLRRFKDRAGDLVWARTDGTTRGMLGLTALTVSMLAVLMYVRVSDEVFQATGAGGPGATVVALTLAVAVALVNVYVLYLSFADGSELTTDADRLARSLRAPLRRRERAQARIDRLAVRVACLSRPEDRPDELPR